MHPAEHAGGQALGRSLFPGARLAHPEEPAGNGDKEVDCTTNITSSAIQSHLTCRWGTASQIPA